MRCIVGRFGLGDGRPSQLPNRSVRESRADVSLLFADGNSEPPRSGSPPRGGRSALNMLDAWKSFAADKKIVLLAPKLPREPKFEDGAPEVFRCVVEDAKRVASIDPSRVYLFGNSMGGYLAYDGAMFESEYFAAIAVHAMRIADDYAWIVNRAHRKTPIAIYIGDHDQFFSQESVRKTRDLLRKSGFPVHYVELSRHDHNYYALSDQINEDAWDFLKQFR